MMIWKSEVVAPFKQLTLDELHDDRSSSIPELVIIFMSKNISSGLPTLFLSYQILIKQ